MRVGAFATVTRTFDAGDVAALATLTDEGSAATGFVPEPLLAALFSYLLGVKAPGRGTNYLKQEIRFLAPAKIGRPLTARVEVTRLRPEKHLCDLETTIRDEDGALLATGRALVFVRDVGA